MGGTGGGKKMWPKGEKPACRLQCFWPVDKECPFWEEYHEIRYPIRTGALAGCPLPAV